MKLAWRNLLRNPAFTVTAILSLALGIGATTAIFTLTNQILLRMIPVKDPGRLVAFHWTGQFIGGSTRGYEDSFSYPMYADLRGSSGAFMGIAAQYQDTVDVAYKGPAERAMAELVSGNYFEVLGVTPAIGRLLTPDEDKRKGGDPYVVLSYDYWQRRFGGDPAVLNSAIDLNGHPMTVLGVAQRGFEGLELMGPADVFVPLMMKTVVTPTWDDMSRRNSIWLHLFARLRPGIDMRAAQSSLAGVYRSALGHDLATNGRSAQFAARYVQNKLVLANGAQGYGGMQAFFSKPLLVLLAMVGTLLLIACANVANLLIARAQGRQKEISIRLALGATRGAVIRLIMSESLCVAAASGVLGLLLSDWIASLLVTLLPFHNIAAAIHTSPDWRVLGFTAGVSLLAALLAGFTPALAGTRPDLAPALKNESRSASLGLGQTRFRRGLICAQVALSFLLLATAGLFARSLNKLMTVDTGMATSRLLAFSVDPSLHNYSPQSTRRLYLDMQSALERLPGAQAASGVSYAILASNAWQNTVHIDSYRPSANEDMNPGYEQTLPGFFQTAGIPLIAGRDFNERDTAGAPAVVIVNETFQRRFFPHASPLGHHIGWGGDGPMPYQIVGVVKDSKLTDLRDKPRPWTFTPALQDDSPGAMTFYIRTAHDPLTAAKSAQQAVHRLDAGLPVFDLKTLDMQIDETHFLDRLLAWLSVAFGALATLLASIGLYGITAFNVTRRTAEIGIRMALGAARGNVLRLVMREVLILAGAGLAIGMIATIALGRLIESQLFEMKAGDPAVLAGAMTAVLLVSLLAGYLPARRATRIDPMRALRWE
ncbi:MAG TPA: ABC transporter permease [Bryobacteraceae bacterium]|nr:ABC transporter permease [Bryobacteraceae bacterium]